MEDGTPNPFWKDCINGFFHFSFPKDFEDELDCVPVIKKDEIIYYYRKFFSEMGADEIKINKILEIAKEELTDERLKSIQMSYQKILVGCLTDSPENEKMWCKYADNNKGYCIEYDVEDCSVFNSAVLPVVYVDKRYDISFSFVSTMILEATRIGKERDFERNIEIYKSVYSKSLKCTYIPVFIKLKDRWEFEKEWRVFLFTHKNIDGDVIRAKDCVDVNNNIHVGSAIKKIYLGRRFSENPNSSSILSELQEISYRNGFEIVMR